MLHFSAALRMTNRDRLILFMANKWILLFGLVYGLFVAVPFLAPVFMRLGWELPGQVVYRFYSLLCHQLPERSFFFFGPQNMYSLTEVQAAFQATFDPLVLRQFIGSSAMGWKVAWSDRMVSMYTSIWFFGVLWWFFRRSSRRLPFWGLLLLGLPMVIDGATHMLSDLAGIGQGFRDTNMWLAELTNHTLPDSFYLGDAFGSFNSWMRLVTGTLFGIGIVWFGFPYLQQVFGQLGELILAKYQAREQILRHAFRSPMDTQK